MSKELHEYEVEIFHKGKPQLIVELYDFTEEDAIRRAISMIWMAKLRDGSEWLKDDITGNIYEGATA